MKKLIIFTIGLIWLFPLQVEAGARQSTEFELTEISNQKSQKRIQRLSKKLSKKKQGYWDSLKDGQPFFTISLTLTFISLLITIIAPEMAILALGISLGAIILAVAGLVKYLRARDS